MQIYLPWELVRINHRKDLNHTPQWGEMNITDCDYSSQSPRATCQTQSKSVSCHQDQNTCLCHGLASLTHFAFNLILCFQKLLSTISDFIKETLSLEISELLFVQWNLNTRVSEAVTIWPTLHVLAKWIHSTFSFICLGLMTHWLSSDFQGHR